MKKILFLISVVTLFSGCLGKQIQTLNHYEIYTPLTNKECKEYIQLNHIVIEVAQKINNIKIAYKEDDNKLEYFVKNKWVSNLQDMLETTLSKIAKNNCISLSGNDNAKNLKLKVLDLYYDSPNNKAIFNAILELDYKQIWIEKQIKIKEGDFTKIINGLNEAVNSGLDEALRKI